jgi:septum formation protein
MAPDAPRIILASGSSSRRALLQAAGLVFEARPVPLDEAAIKNAMRGGASAGDTALALADAKAAFVTDPDALVIGADQMLVCDGLWFDKPPSMDAAREQLLALRGCAHELMTAVVCWRGGHPVWRHLARPRLVMRDFSETFLDAYLAAEGEGVLSSVGAYRLEGLGLQLFDAVDGEHTSVLGLPMLALLGWLRGQGIVLT